MVGLIDKNGTQVVSYVYDAWGRAVSVTGSSAATAGALNPFRYRGYEYDTESGLYYLNSRYYDPMTMRFVNGDCLLSSVGGLTGMNMFIYCGNNPICLVDPSGTLWEINGKVYSYDGSIADFRRAEQGLSPRQYDIDAQALMKQNSKPIDFNTFQKQMQKQQAQTQKQEHAHKVLSFSANFMSWERTAVTSLGSIADLTLSQSAGLSIYGYASSTPLAIATHVNDPRLSLSQKTDLILQEITYVAGGVVISCLAPAGGWGIVCSIGYQAYTSYCTDRKLQSYYRANEYFKY